MGMFVFSKSWFEDLTMIPLEHGLSMGVATLLDSRQRPALKRRAKQRRPVNRPEKARRASLFSPTVHRRAFAAGAKQTFE
jgi:hypothetical protein